MISLIEEVMGKIRGLEHKLDSFKQKSEAQTSETVAKVRE